MIRLFDTRLSYPTQREKRSELGTLFPQQELLYKVSIRGCMYASPRVCVWCRHLCQRGDIAILSTTTRSDHSLKFCQWNHRHPNLDYGIIHPVLGYTFSRDIAVGYYMTICLTGNICLGGDTSQACKAIEATPRHIAPSKMYMSWWKHMSSGKHIMCLGENTSYVFWETHHMSSGKHPSNYK